MSDRCWECGSEAVVCVPCRYTPMREERDRLLARVEELERRLFPDQGHGYANEVERQRYVIDELTAIADGYRARVDALTDALRAATEWLPEHDPIAQGLANECRRVRGEAS